MTYTGLPVLGGRTLPRPTGVQRTSQAARSRVVLAGGSARVYNNGARKVFALSWARMTEADLAALEGVCRSQPFAAYLDLDGVTYVVETGDVDATAIAATDPVMFTASVTLTQQDSIR